MPKIRSLCVYCGSSRPHNPKHTEAGQALGKLLAEQNIDLVYGGARVGLMGIIADACLDAGGRVIGIIPEHLQKYEVGHSGVTKLHIVENMHVRKMMMFDYSDAFAVMPGGYGTLDEFFEVLTWRQIKMHDKPIVLVDIDSYWHPLRVLLNHIINTGYAQEDTKNLLSIVDDVSKIISAVEDSPPPLWEPEKKWM